MRRFSRILGLGLCCILGLALGPSCNDDTSTAGGARLYQVLDRGSLIGGPMALGDLGDFVLENSRIKLVVSKVGISRAFGLFGGNIVDADRVRSAIGQGNSSGGQGFDTLVEMFPLFFLGAVDPKASSIINDGKDGKAARLQVTGEGASFIALTESINNFVTFPDGKNRLAFAVDYILEPGKDYIQLKITVTNKDEKEYRFGGLLGKLIPAITGMVGLFGKRNTVFIPGIAGYNIRFSLQEIFKSKLKAPAIPGLIGDFVASWGTNGVSYGLVAESHKENYVFANKEEFSKLGVPIDEGSLIVPLEGSSITAAFTKQAPFVLKKDQSYEYNLYMVIGDGSVSSIRNAQLEIHKKPKGILGGRLVEAGTYLPVVDAHIFAYTGKTPTGGVPSKPGDRLFYTDMRTDAQGNFLGHLEPGTYTLLARTGTMQSNPIQVEIKKDERQFVQMEMPQFGYVTFTVRDQRGRLIPAKVTVLGKASDFTFQGKKGGCVGKSPIYCLYDPHLDEGKLDTNFDTGLTCSDGKTCTSHLSCQGVGDGICDFRLGPETEYREAMHHSHSGLGRIAVRPGTYKIVASRGIEYELGIETGVSIEAGKVNHINFTIQHSVQTPKSVSVDLHVHTNFSHDVSISDRSRVASFAAEGVDAFVTTDHNRIRDMQPIVLSLGLERWLKTIIGVELTTFEMGHFNAFPLKLDVNSFNGGNPDWFKQDARYKTDIEFPAKSGVRPIEGLRLGVPPAEMFAQLRQRGELCDNDRKCQQTIVQVNHPRDAIFGYFNTYSISPDSGYPIYKKHGLFANATQPISREYDADAYSAAFDAIEVFNGPRFDLLWHWRIPPDANAPAGYGGGPGTKIRTNNNGRADIAFPGGVDDWFNFLNRGVIYTATANSDSHNHDPEAGFPRSYLLTGSDNPIEVTGKVIVDSILKRQVMMTNGPILEVVAIDESGKEYPIGSTVKASKTITFRIKVRAASWIDVSEIIIYKNGRVAKTIPVTEKKQVERFAQDIKMDIGDADAWFVIFTKGSKGLWPVLRAEEIEPFQIGQAVGLIQDALLSSLPISLGGSDPACLRPSIVRRVLPYAFTNPFWVDIDGNGFKPDPCKTLGEKGVRCGTKGATCQDGACIDPAQACQADADCKQEDNTTYNRCIDGKCTIDPCIGVTCASAATFLACDDKIACPNDLCADKDRQCKDGTPCTKDGDCAGKDDELCRYCACPDARKACDNGKSCTSEKDCEGKPCTSQRFCHPTACSLGQCVPTYPTCTIDAQDQSAHLFLKTTKPPSTGTLVDPGQAAPQAGFQRINYATMRSLPKEKQPVTADQFTIRRARSFFLFFEHKH